MNEANIYIPGVKEFQEGRMEVLRYLVDTGKLSEKDAAETLGMSVAEFNETTKKMSH